MRLIAFVLAAFVAVGSAAAQSWKEYSYDGEDGSHATVALFDYKGRLYQIEGIALPGGNGSEADALRFQQSLTFTAGGSNRSEEAIRAIREGCRRAGANPAGLDDPRCRR